MRQWPGTYIWFLFVPYHCATPVYFFLPRPRWSSRFAHSGNNFFFYYQLVVLATKGNLAIGIRYEFDQWLWFKMRRPDGFIALTFSHVPHPCSKDLKEHGCGTCWDFLSDQLVIHWFVHYILGHSAGLANMIETLLTNNGFFRPKQIITYSCIHGRLTVLLCFHILFLYNC